MHSASSVARHLALVDDPAIPVDTAPVLPFDPTTGETARERLLFDALDRRQRRSPVRPVLLHRGHFATGETLVILGYVRAGHSGCGRSRSLEAMQFDRHDRLLHKWVVLDRRRIADVLRAVRQYGNAESPATPCIGRLEVRFELDAAVA